MTSVCIVTNELYPLHKGGIGRLMYNFALHNARSQNRADLHFLLPNNFTEASERILSQFEGLATVHFCPGTIDGTGLSDAVPGPLKPKDSLDAPMFETLRYYSGLLAAQERHGAEFDFVEFPDFGAWGIASIWAKRAGLNFRKTRFVIRLHSSLSLIVDHEPFVHQPSEWLAAVCDLERMAVYDADIVLAHIESTARLNAERFGFPPEWMRKVRVEMPPILLSDAERAALREQSPHDGSGANFIFSSRLQLFKRPDIFVRAAVRFLDLDPGAENRFLVASYGWSKDYIEWLQFLVPERWREQIVFLENLPEEERIELMLDSTLVIPSDFESLCLLAYEARQMGIKLVLNRRCLAFGAEPGIWRDGENCLFFNGDFISLEQAMRRSLEWSPAADEPRPPVTMYWEQPMERPQGDRTAVPPLSVGFLLYGGTDLEEVGRRVQSLRKEFKSSEICIVAPRQAFDLAGAKAKAWESFGVRVFLTSWPEPTPSEMAASISLLEADAVAFLPAWLKVDRIFWRLASEALGENPDAAIFTSFARTARTEHPFVLYYGEAANVSLLADRLAHHGSVLRRDAVQDAGIREQAGDRWFEDLCVRLLRSGHRVITAPAALVTDDGETRHSRINSARFFATLNDEAAQAAGFPVRRNHFVKLLDSAVFEEHEAWLKRQKKARRDMYASARTAREQNLRFGEVELKSATNDDGTGYRALEIVMREVTLASTSISFVGFKLTLFRDEPQLEFRDHGNAGHVFGAWPPPTSDQWGPVAVWAPAGHHPHGNFFENVSEDDFRKLKVLIQSLPDVLELLPLSPEERKLWIGVAQSLHRNREAAAVPLEPVFT